MEDYIEELINLEANRFMQIREYEMSKMYYGTDNYIYPKDADLILFISKNEGISITELAKNDNISKTAMSNTITKLTKKDLLMRNIDENDKRKQCVFLTAQGHIVIHFYKKFLQYKLDTLKKSLSVYDTETIKHLVNEREKYIVEYEKLYKRR